MKYTKITAVAAAFIMLAQTGVSADYYVERSKSSVNADELIYEPFSEERLNEYVMSAESLLDGEGNSTEISIAIDHCRDEYLEALEQYRLAMLKNDSDYNEETSAERSEAYNNALNAFKTFGNMITRVSKSEEYAPLLENIFGEGGADEFVADLPSEKYYELSRQEEELVNEYMNVVHDSDACAKIYTELVAVRNNIAKECGYDSYTDYAHESIYARDYTREEISDFSDAVAENFSGMFEDIFNATMIVRNSEAPMSESEAMQKIGSMVSEISPELKTSFDYMADNKLYNISYSDSKNNASGSYTLVLPKIKAPYMFVNASVPYEKNASDNMRTIIHEFGHYSALLNDPALLDENIELKGSFAMDTCEVQSQGLEALSESYYGRLFGSGASYERYVQLMQCLGAVIDGCMFNEFQTRVYDEKITDIDRLNSIMQELLKKYYDLDYSPETAQGLWTSMIHNFEAPMYYISYSVSGAAALELLLESRTDMDSAIDKYMKFSALGGYVKFDEAMQKAGIDDIFNKEAVERIADGVKAEYGLGYEDVENNSWYEPYVLYTSHIFDGADETQFRPQYNISRSDFIELIGRAYDYYVGIDDEYEITFDDVDSDSDSAEYIAWAFANGIVDGYSDGEFGGSDSITREQLVVILYRLNALEGGQSDSASFEGFTDADDVSEWARNAMAWAVENGIITGRDDNTIDPQGNATRAEAAKIESCYIESIY